jgi:hypothetical protein
MPLHIYLINLREFFLTDDVIFDNYFYFC